MSKFLKEGEGSSSLEQREGGEIIDEQLKSLLDDMWRTFTGEFDPELQPEKTEEHFDKVLYDIEDVHGKNAFEERGESLIKYLKENFKKENIKSIINTILNCFGMDRYNVMNAKSLKIKRYFLLQILETLNYIDKNVYAKSIDYIEKSKKLPFINYSFFGEEKGGFVWGEIIGRTNKDFDIFEAKKGVGFYTLREVHPYELTDEGKDAERNIPVGEIYRKFWEEKEASKLGEKGIQASRMAAVNQEGLAETLESRTDIEGLIDQIWASPRVKWAEIIFPQMPMIFEEMKKNPKKFSERLLKKFEFDTCLILPQEKISARAESFVMILELLKNFGRFTVDITIFHEFLGHLEKTNKVATMNAGVFFHMIVGMSLHELGMGTQNLNRIVSIVFTPRVNFEVIYEEYISGFDLLGTFKKYWKEKGVDVEEKYSVRHHTLIANQFRGVIVKKGE